VQKTILITLIAAGMAMTVTTANANPIIGGQTGVSPDIFSALPGSLIVTQTLDLNSATFTASVTEAVYSGTNAVCPTSNCLSFLYQVTDNGAVGTTSTGIMEDLTASFFTGFITDVGFYNATVASGPFVAGGVDPLTVGRSSAGPGSVVSFNYADMTGGANSLTPGLNTSILIVETDAVNYDALGFFSGIDGATATDQAFEPAAAAPEPVTAALLGAALIGVGLWRKRRMA
jgi:hypothetical protein